MPLPLPDALTPLRRELAVALEEATQAEAASPQVAPEIARAEYMFPFVSVVECPQARMLERIGPTLVATAVTDDAGFRSELVDCAAIDRLNLGPIPTTKLDWLQPHEGNIIDFLYRSRALQMAG